MTPCRVATEERVRGRNHSYRHDNRLSPALLVDTNLWRSVHPGPSTEPMENSIQSCCLFSVRLRAPRLVRCRRCTPLHACDSVASQFVVRSPILRSIHARSQSAISRLFVSCISMCELPRIPTFGSSMFSTLPPRLLTASANVRHIFNPGAQRDD